MTAQLLWHALAASFIFGSIAWGLHRLLDLDVPA